MSSEGHIANSDTILVMKKLLLVEGEGYQEFCIKAEEEV
jgi:hypothetical protein